MSWRAKRAGVGDKHRVRRYLLGLDDEDFESFVAAYPEMARQMSPELRETFAEFLLLPRSERAAASHILRLPVESLSGFLDSVVAERKGR